MTRDPIRINFKEIKDLSHLQIGDELETTNGIERIVNITPRLIVTRHYFAFRHYPFYGLKGIYLPCPVYEMRVTSMPV